MTARFIVALDLSKQAHVGYIYDTTTQRLSKALRVPVSAEGFARLDAELRRYSTHPADFLIGHAATGHYGETVLHASRLRQRDYPTVELNAVTYDAPARGPGQRAETTAAALQVLAQYPSRRALAEAPLAELTAVIQQASRGQKGEALARQVQAIARVSVGFSGWLGRCDDTLRGRCFNLVERDGRLHPQCVLNLRDAVRVLHQLTDVVFARLRRDFSPIRYVLGRFTFGPKLTFHFNFDPIYLNPSLCRFTVDVVAVAGG